MTTTWDEPKRKANLAKHGYDFPDFDTCFNGETALILPTRPSASGRRRYKLLGEWAGVRVVAAVVSLLGSEPFRSSACALPIRTKGKPMPNTSLKPDGPGLAQEDWDEVSDNPKLTPAELAALRPAQEVPEVYALLPKRGRGRPKLADAKVNLTLRIEPDVIAGYKATGPGWQTRMGEVLARGLPKAGAA